MRVSGASFLWAVYVLHIDVQSELAHRIPVEIVLVVLDLVENPLYTNISFERHSQVAIAAVAICVFDQILYGLHVFEIGARTRCIFLGASRECESRYSVSLCCGLPVHNGIACIP